MLSALELQERRGLMHPREQCDAEKVAALVALRRAIEAGLRRLAKDAASPGKPERWIVERGREVFRGAFDDLRRSFGVDDAAAAVHAEDARGDPVARRPDPEPVG